MDTNVEKRYSYIQYKTLYYSPGLELVAVFSYGFMRIGTGPEGLKSGNYGTRGFVWIL